MQGYWRNGERKGIRPGGGSRALAILLTLGLLAGCGEGDPDKSAADYIASAETKLADNSYDAAIIQLKNALKAQPDNAEARLMLGRTYLDTYQTASANKELRRAREAGAAPAKVLPLLAETFNRQNEPERTLELVAEAPDAVAQELPLQLRQADALLALDRTEDAARLLDGLPDTSAVLQRRATLELVRGNGARALDLAAEAARGESAGAEAHLIHGRLLTRVNGDPASARGAFEKATQADPRSPQALLALARAEVQAQRFDAAAETLDRFDKLGLASPVATYLRAVMDFQGGNYEAARDKAQGILSDYPGYTQAAVIAGLAQSQLGNHEIAITHLKKAVGSDGSAPPAVLQALARSNLALNRPEQALTYLERGNLAERDSRTSKLAAAAALAGQNYDKGMSLLERVLADEPGNVQAATTLASLKHATGQAAAGDKILAELSESGALEDAGNKVRVGLTYLRTGDYEKAVELAEEVKAQRPKDAPGYLLHGLALRGLGKPDAAAEQLARAIELDPDNATASLQLADVRRAQGQADTATKVLEDALQRSPDSAQLKLPLARLKMEQGELARGEALIREVIEARPEAVEPRLILARFLLTQDRPQAALEQAQAAADGGGDSPEVLSVLGRAQQAAGSQESAIRTFQRLADRQPQSADAHFRLAQSYAAVGDAGQAEASLRKVLELRDDADRARLILARLLVQQGDLDAASPHIQQLQSELPDNPDVAALAGAYYLQRGDPGQAVAAYQRAYDRDPQPDRARVLARVQWRADDPEGAMATLDTALERADAAAVAARLHTELAGMARQHGQPDRALTHYEQAVSARPDNAAYHNDYAWTLWTTGALDAARTHAEKALELAPDNPAIKDTLAVVLLDQGEIGRAERLLEEAVDAAPERPDLRFHLAQARAKGGKTDEAIALLEAIVQRGDTTYKPRAQELLKKLRDG